MKKVKLALLVLVFALTSISIPINQIHIMAESGITRGNAEQRALNMINLSWTYSRDKNSKLDPSSANIVVEPNQFKGIDSAVMTGIPYDWGGLDTNDTNTYGTPWDNFLDAVNKGAYAGNSSSIGGIGYVNGTAGVDCSGFVQAAFNIKGTKLSTSTLFNQFFKPISLSDIKHMDILNYPGHHVVIFDRWGSRNGVQGAYTYEATTNQGYGGIQGTKKYFISLRAINNAYTPGRYIYIIDDASVSKTGTMPQMNSTTKSKNAQINNNSKVTNNSQASSTATSNDTITSNQTSETVSPIQKPKTNDGTIMSIESTPSGFCNANYSDNLIHLSDDYPNIIF